MYASAAWMPMIPIYFGTQNPSLGQQYSLAGAAARLGVLYSGLPFINTGLELAGSWYMLYSNTGGSGLTLHHAVTAGANLVLQKRPSNRSIALDFRLGAGLSFLPGSGVSFSMDQSLYTNIGVSFIIFVSDHFFLETGIDHNHWFTKEPSGCIKPWLGLGWQF